MRCYQTYFRKLSIVIASSLVMAFMFCPLSVLASGEHGGGGTGSSERPNTGVGGIDDERYESDYAYIERLPNGDFWLKGGTVSDQLVYLSDWIMRAGTKIGAILSLDFAQYIRNEEAFQEHYMSGVNFNAETQEIVFSEDFLSYLKDMILQYQIETSGFIYYPTISYKDISANLYPNKITYDTVKNLCEAHGLVAFHRANKYYLSFYPFSSTELSENSFVWVGTYDTFLEYDSTVKETFLNVYDNETWNEKKFEVYKFSYSSDSAITADGNYEIWGGSCFEQFTPINVTSQLFIGNGLRTSSLMSSDGRKIKIYMGLDSFKNNTAGTRSVYLTEQFYDDTITSLAINFKSLAKFQEAYYKEMLKAINNSGLTDKQYDDLLEALHDIEKKEGMTEDELARILQQFADQIADALNSGSGSGSGSESGGGSSTDVSGIESLLESISSTLSSGLSGISDTIAAWGASIEAMLEEISLQVGDISWQLGEMTQEEFTGKMDSTTDQLFDVFSESGEILKTKFPFCIPWDIHSLLAKLGGAGIPQQAALYSLDDRPAGGVWNPTPTGRPVEQWVSSAEEEKMEAPKFEIPFVIESAGISDTLTIDLKYFNAVSKVSRVMFTLVFCGVLIKLTFPVVGFINEFVNGN